MSDSEEPAAKIVILQQPEQAEEMEEGQEEWLSEGVLTDDDYNPTGENDQSDYANMSQEDTMPSVNDAIDNDNAYHDTGDSNAQDGHERDEGNIEQTLNNMENSQEKDFPDELGAFLIRKTDNRIMQNEIKDQPEERESEIEEGSKHSDDDGHDTDELLRMLGEDVGKVKNKQILKSIVDKRRDESTEEEDDDDYIFEGAKVTRLKMAKNAFIKKYPSKAIPEDLSDKEEDSEASPDEAITVKSMFGVGRRPGLNVASKSTTIGGINALQTVTKRVISLDNSDRRPSLPQRPPVKVGRGPGRPPKPRPEPEHHEEEFLEEDFDLDEEMESEGEMERGSRVQSGQRIMRPERMDEEVPTDGESQSEEDSLYDEMPSSESEDLDEWFTLDIRAERAGEYLPFLGAQARQLLIAERQRVGARVATLRQSLSALAESGRQQSEQLSRATASLAELDAALKA